MSSALDSGISHGFGGSYLAAFVELLEQDFMQPCSLTGAVDLLMGERGVLRAALIADTEHWSVRNFDIDREVRFMKGWITARLQFLQGSVNEACALSAECARLVSATSWSVGGRPVGEKRPQNCRFASEMQLRALCAESGIAPTTPTICKQSSRGPTCVIDTDPCASAPCQNGGDCRSFVVRSSGALVEPGVLQPGEPDIDACGCVVGSNSGWSSSAKACWPGKSTSQTEARACIERRAIATGISVETEMQRWLAYQCDCNGGWSGPTCETAGQVGPDVCGCELGSGWSKSQRQCKPGGSTSASEAANCASGDGSAMTHGTCDMATLGRLSAASCPVAGPGSLTPDQCPPACAATIVPFWTRCSADQALTEELGAQLSTAMEDFVRTTCGGAGSGVAPGGGH
eukprot:COSAG02_NODE_9525_length_2189_cov_1.639234_2_plen_402_part_00